VKEGWCQAPKSVPNSPGRPGPSVVICRTLVFEAGGGGIHGILGARSPKSPTVHNNHPQLLNVTCDYMQLSVFKINYSAGIFRAYSLR